MYLNAIMGTVGAMKTMDLTLTWDVFKFANY